jgi:hypothetical protein
MIILATPIPGSLKWGGWQPAAMCNAGRGGRKPQYSTPAYYNTTMVTYSEKTLFAD